MKPAQGPCATLLSAAGLSLLLSCVMGCHSAFVQATVYNDSDRVIRVFEVDYPSASFGGSALAPGSVLHSRFKLLGDGPIKVTWTDGHDQEHTATGPALQEGQEGTLSLHLSISLFDLGLVNEILLDLCD